MSRPLAGFLLGVLVAALFVAVTTPFASDDKSLWWWPAALVAGAIGGGVLGALVGTEASGESPDERYDGPGPKA
jgi:hypothetical protein